MYTMNTYTCRFFRPIIYENIYENRIMQQISISDIQRNLHKLDGFDIVEIVDKKRNKVKGYFIDSRYFSIVKELIEKKKESEILADDLAGSLQEYANPELIKEENGAWKKHIKEKYAR